MTVKTDYKVVIIGGGVIGLAVARALAERNESSVLIIEKEGDYGRGTSSRNSEVIHSGIYYFEGSEKAEYCVEANQRLYDYCIKENVWHNRCGKLIVAQKGQEAGLDLLLRQANQNGVQDVRTLTRTEIVKLEPDVSAESALLLESTGIISAHELMTAFYRESQSADQDILYRYQVRDINQLEGFYSIDIEGQASITEKVRADWVVNAGGLFSAEIAGFVMNENVPELRFSKGDYFNLTSHWRNRFHHLIYPLPDEEHDSLGIHLSFDQSGSGKLGPSAVWLDELSENYKVDLNLGDTFFHEARQYLHNLQFEHLSPGYSGIRAKYFPPGKNNADFYIKHESDAGLEGWINLVGIDSPGLTAAITIGEYAAKCIFNE